MTILQLGHDPGSVGPVINDDLMFHPPLAPLLPPFDLIQSLLNHLPDQGFRRIHRQQGESLFFGKLHQGFIILGASYPLA